MARGVGDDMAWGGPACSGQGDGGREGRKEGEFRKVSTSGVMRKT